MEFDPLVRNFVRRAHARRAGVVVVELPGKQSAVRIRCALDLYNSRWAEIGPGELLFACPNQTHRFAGGFRQARTLDCCLAAVLPPVSRSGVRHEHAHIFFLHVERGSQFIAYCERALCAGPDGELAVVPFGHRRARFERCVRDVSNCVSLLQSLRGSRACLLDRAFHNLSRPSVGFSSVDFRCSNRSFSETCCGASHFAWSASAARSAVIRSGAVTPTKSPSRMTVTPGSFSAAEVSHELNL